MKPVSRKASAKVVPLETVCLELIEEIAVNEAAETPENPRSNWSMVYIAAHTARNAECRKNHQDWAGRVRRAWRAINRGRLPSQQRARKGK